MKERKKLLIFLYVLLILVEMIMMSIQFRHDLSYGFAEYDITKEVSLNKGIYKCQIDCDVQTYDDEDTYFFVRGTACDPKQQYSFEMDEQKLKSGINRKEWNLYVDTDNVGIWMYLGREGDFADIYVYSYALEYDALKTAVQALAVAVFWFSVLDLLVFVLLFRKQQWDRLWKKEGKYVLFAACILFIVNMPLLTNNGLILSPKADLDFHLKRIVAIAEGLRSGIFPVKIYPGGNNGYGYAAGVFYPDLFLYLPAILYILGVKLRTAYVIYGFAVSLLTYIISVFCFRRMTEDKVIASVTAALYTSGIYRLNDVYTRSAVGEYTAMMFFPLVICGCWIIYHEKGKGFFHLAIGMAGIIQSHLLSSIVVLEFLLLFAIIRFRQTICLSTLKEIGKAVSLCALLTLNFTIPFLDYWIHVPIVENDYEIWYGYGHAASLGQLFTTKYNVTGASRLLEVQEDMPLSVGIASLAILFLAGILLFREDLKRRQIIKTELILCIISLLISTTVVPYYLLAEHAENLYRFIMRVQFPWRYLMISCILLAALGMEVFLAAKSNYRKEMAYLIGAAILAVNLLQSVSYCSEFIKVADRATCINDDSNIATIDYLPKTVSAQDESARDLLSAAADGLVSDVTVGPLSVDFTVEKSSTEKSFMIPLNAYKGYKAYGEQGSLELMPGDGGHLSVIVPVGYNGTVSVRFFEPWYWKVSYVVTALTSVGVIIYIWNKQKKKRIMETGLC